MYREEVARKMGTRVVRRIRYCSRCVMPETRPDLSLDADGVCDACRSAGRKDEIDWEARRTELAGILEKYKGRGESPYDCIIPSSGGKDSHYQAYMIKHIFGLNPLCVTWTPCNQTELGKKNVRNLQRMGVDYVEFTGNRQVYRQLVKLGFELIGDPCWPEHVGIFTVPVQEAVRHRVPLVIWGEKGQFEYGGPESSRTGVVLNRRWMEEFGGLRGLRVEDAMRLLGLSPRDLAPFVYASDRDLGAVGVRGIFLGQFLRWDARRQLETIKELGFAVNKDGPQEGTYTNYENLDCKYVGIHDYLMYCKYGFGRATSHACIDIRNGRLSREEGMRLVREYDGRVPRRYLAEFLEDVAITEEDFFRICDIFVNKSAFVVDPLGRPVRDQDGDLVKRNYDNDDALEEFGSRPLVATGREVANHEALNPRRYADVTIVDYGMGNLRSVAKAFEALGYKVLVTSRPSDIEIAERIVLPGVGAFGDGMQELRTRRILSAMTERVIGCGVPFLGICLGMQLLAEVGLENGTHPGLGWIAGQTVQLAPSDRKLRVPHIGWNDVEFTAGSRLGRDVGRTGFYFVHGYHLVPTDRAVACGTVCYGDEIVAAMECQNIFGTQFHPEKSQRAGLAVLRNFMQA